MVVLQVFILVGLLQYAYSPHNIYSFFFHISGVVFFFFFSSRRRHTRLVSDWSSDVCSSDLVLASSYLHAWDPRQYLSPLWSGNVTLVEFLRGTSIDLFNAFQRFHGGNEYPYWMGSTLEKTPESSLGLRPGEWVRVRTKDEILQTLDRRNRNRGLWFDREMLRYCGRRFRVLRRVDRLIEEKSGRLVQVKTPCLILGGVTARGEFYRFNPQNDYILWREIWLERAQP